MWVAHPFVVPYWRRGEVAAALAALAKPDGIIERFTAAFLRRVGAERGVPTGSGRLAIELALRQVGVADGGEVILPTFGCGALVAAVRAAGGTCVFADVDRDLCLDPDAVAGALSERTRAVVVVHAGGKRARSDEITALVRARGVAVVEDFAQATGAPWPRVGSWAIYSFGPGKNTMATGGGFLVGAVDERLPAEPRAVAAGRLLDVSLRYRLARYTRPAYVAMGKLASRGAPEDRSDPYPRVALAPSDAAIMERQLGSLDEIIARRRRNALALRAALADVDGVVLPDPGDHVFTKFYVALPASAGGAAVRIVRTLLARGFEPELAYTPLHRRFPRADGDGTRFPVAESICPRLLTLPVRPGLSERDMRRLADALRDAVALASR